MPYLPYYMAGWPLKWAGETAQRAPDVRVLEHPDGTFQVISVGPGGSNFKFDNPYDAANGLAGGLISVFVSRDPQMVCLHAGAARVGDGLVVVIGDPFAGKSIVALHLAVLGNTFFGDEQVCVTFENPSRGMCLGLMPKVPLPLPEDCGDAFREFVERVFVDAGRRDGLSQTLGGRSRDIRGNGAGACPCLSGPDGDRRFRIAPGVASGAGQDNGLCRLCPAYTLLRSVGRANPARGCYRSLSSQVFEQS